MRKRELVVLLTVQQKETMRRRGIILLTSRPVWTWKLEVNLKVHVCRHLTVGKFSNRNYLGRYCRYIPTDIVLVFDLHSHEFFSKEQYSGPLHFPWARLQPALIHEKGIIGVLNVPGSLLLVLKKCLLMFPAVTERNSMLGAPHHKMRFLAPSQMLPWRFRQICSNIVLV